MNKSIKICCISLLTTLLFMNGAIAQEESTQIGAVEIFACNFNDGKTMNNLNTVIRRWNQWADQHKINDYIGMTLVPLYRSSEVTADVL